MHQLAAQPRGDGLQFRTGFSGDYRHVDGCRRDAAVRPRVERQGNASRPYTGLLRGLDQALQAIASTPVGERVTTDLRLLGRTLRREGDVGDWVCVSRD